MSATLFTLREVNDASFPDHAMSGHLDELLRSPGSQPVRCVATAPGHVVVSVAGGKYLHAFSARTPRPARVGATPTEPTLAPSDSLAPNERDERSRSSLERTERSWEDDDRAWERTEESFLSFHGASRVARVVFVPPDASNATPLALLAAQEDGGVAAWRWCCEDTEPEPRWVPCAPPAFAGGPPLVAAPFDDAYVTENGFVFDAALLAARAAEGRRRVRLACLTSGPSASGSRGATRRTPKTPTLVVIDVGFLDVVLEGKADCAVLLRAETAGRNAREDATNLSPRAVLALGPVPRAAAVLSAGGDEFWVVAGGTGGSNEDTVVTRWSSCVAGKTRATRRVDLSLAARVADAAAAAADASASAHAEPELSGNFQKFPEASRPNRTRLATCLHSPSHELLAVTERGNVLCLSPGLRGFDAEASESQASENEKQKTHSTRHVGRLRGGDFVASADFEAMESRDGPRVAAREPRFATIDLHSIIARGPFLYLAHKTWADNTASIEKTATRETREEPSACVSAYHLSSGVALGTVPLPAPPPLARGSGDATEEEGRKKQNGLVVRLVDGGAARALVTATAHGRAAGVFVVDPPPAAATLARAYVGRGDEIERERVSFSRAADGKGLSEGLSDEGLSATPTDRSSPIGVSVASLRAARRECAWFGGALERLDASAALALAELEMKERARGRNLSREALSSDRDATATANANDSDGRFDAFVSNANASPTRARVVERALAACFRTRNHEESRPDAERRDERDECDDFAAFAAFSELGAESSAAIAAPGSEPSSDEGERRGRFDETIGPFSMTECPPEDVASLRAGLAALDAAAAVPAPWERGAGTRESRTTTTRIPGPEVRTEERAIWREEGRDALRAVAASIRASRRVEKKRTGSETDQTDRPASSAAPEAETLETLDDFQSVRAFLAAADANRDYKYRDPASSMEAAATLLAETAVVRDAGEGATDDEDDPFASACACAHAARPRLAVWLVARAAARAAEAGVFPDARAAARVLATRALAAAPPVPEERAHDAAAASRAALLSLAGHAHAATWLLLTRGAARGEGARREVLADAEDEAPKRGRADEREDARTSSFGWVFAARLLGGEARADLASAGGVFETLASALRHVARRDATGEVSGAFSDEVDPGTAATQTLRAATTLAEAMETRTREGTHAEDRSRRIERKDAKKKSGSVPEFGTDALERLVAAAAARVAATTDELEKTAKAYAA